MRKIVKIIISLLIIFTTIFSVNSHLYKVEAAGISEIISGANDFVSKGEAEQSDTIDQGKLLEGANLIYSIFFAIGTFLATAVGIIVGIKLMAAGSAEEKAQYKKILEVYIAGCVVIFGAVGIWKLVINTINASTPTASTSTGVDSHTAAVLAETDNAQRARAAAEQKDAEEAAAAKKQQEEYQKKVDSKALDIARQNGALSNGTTSGATSVPESAQIDLEPYRKQAEEELLDDYIGKVTAEQDSQIRSRALQKMKDDGMNVTPSSGATSVPTTQAVTIPDEYYREAAKELMIGSQAK